MRISAADLDEPELLDLLRLHARTARAATALGSAHALDPAALRGADIEVWTIREGEDLLGIGALQQLSGEHGEIKSMHTVAGARRRGVGSAMLTHIIGTARMHGLTRLSLETGSWDYFRPARALYRRHGFIECKPFGNYVADVNSIFMTLDLRAPDRFDARL
jgi:putative acetyltransferase